MPKKLNEELLSKIEEIYLSDESETYASLAKRFQVGLSSLERIGKERGWGRKRDQQKARRATKLLKQSASPIVIQSSEKLNFAEFDEFSHRRLLSVVRQALVAFESVISQNAENPRVLANLAGGLTKLVEAHTKLQPITASDLVEILIQAGVTPDEFLAQLRREYIAKKRA